MQKVHKQIQMIRELLDELDKVTNDRSSWKTLSLPNRITEAQAIADSAKALVSICRRASPELWNETV